MKVLAATRSSRGVDRQKDIQDLVRLAPCGDDLAAALRWVATRRPADDFWSVRAVSLLDDLGAASLGEAVEAARSFLSLHGGA